jgi:dynein heavy chain, axonemal
MISECQYGGRVTDDYDKRLLSTFTSSWFNQNMFSESFKFIQKSYVIPNYKKRDDVKSFILDLPNVDSPEVFGLNVNADITYQTNTVQTVIETILDVQPKESNISSGQTREDVVYNTAKEMVDKLPSDYLAHEIKKCLIKMNPVASMSIFLRQEIDRIQKVITIVRRDLVDLQLAIDGTIIMNENLKNALDSIYDAKVPKLWQRISWESSTLGFWFTELIERNIQLKNWIFGERPLCFWLTGFFNCQGFLTAMRQVNFIFIIYVY